MNQNVDNTPKKHYIKLTPELHQINKSLKLDLILNSYKDILSEDAVQSSETIKTSLDNSKITKLLNETTSNIFILNSLNSNKSWLKPILSNDDNLNMKKETIDSSAVINSEVMSNNIKIHVSTKSVMNRIKSNNGASSISQYTAGLLNDKINNKTSEIDTKNIENNNNNTNNLDITSKLSYKTSNSHTNLSQTSINDQQKSIQDFEDDYEEDDDYKSYEAMSDCKVDEASISEDSGKYKRKIVKLRLNETKFNRIWSFISKKDIPKIQRQKCITRNNFLQSLKKVSLGCQKEVRKEALKSQKNSKDSVQKAKRIAKEMLIFWKKFDKVEKETRKKVEKEAMEMWKNILEMKELKRQQRKLNFLLTQTELYAHFMSKKSLDIDQDETKIKILKGMEEEKVVYNNIVDIEDNNYDVERAKNEVLSVVKNAIQRQRFNTEQYKTDASKTSSQAAFDESFSLANPENDVKEILQPKMLRGTLKKYQIKGLSWLAGLYDQGINGILADEMGLGKTVQTIAFLSYLAESQNIWGPFMIVAPASTLHNWQQEINKFVPDLKVLPYWGDTRDRKSLRQFWNHNKHTIHTKNEAPFHILITSYQLIVSDIKYFQRIMWQYLVLDEAQSIKSSSSQRWKTLLSFKCRNRLLLTGTPIQNTMAELWALLHFIMPTLFDNHQEFNEWFSKDIEGHVENKSILDQTQLTRLHLILKPFMLRRIKKDVENELSDKIELKIDCYMTNRQKALYKSLRNKITLEDLIINSDLYNGSANKHATINISSSSSNHLMNLVMQFRKVCNHPELFERRDFISPYYFKENLCYLLPKLLFNEEILEKFALIKNNFLLTKHTTNSYCVLLNRFYHNKSFFQNRYHSHFKKKSSFIETLISPSINLSEKIQSNYILPHQPYIGSIRGFYDYKIFSKSNNSISEAVESEIVYYPSFIYLSYIPKAYSSVTDIYCSSNRWYFKNKDFNNHLNNTNNNYSPVIQTKNEIKFIFNKPTNNEFYKPFYGWSFIISPDQSNLIRDSGKLIELDNLLTRLKLEGHKVLVYSQMTKMIDILEEFMVFRRHKYMRLDGSSKISDRRDMVIDFQSDSAVFVFLLSTRAGGLGINLTAADTVIFYDSDWNPTVDQQAMDRAHRLGQTRQVTVYRLIMSGTIEERILKRAKEKSEIQSMVITGNVNVNDSNDNSFKAKEVVSLLLDDDEMEMKFKQKQEQRKIMEDSGLIKKRGRKRKLDSKKHDTLKNTDESFLLADSSNLESGSSLNNTKNSSNNKGKSLKQKTSSVLEQAALTIGKNIVSVAAYASYGLSNPYNFNQNDSDTKNNSKLS